MDEKWQSKGAAFLELSWAIGSSAFLLVGWILHNFGWQWVFIILGCAQIPFIFLLFFTMPQLSMMQAHKESIDDTNDNENSNTLNHNHNDNDNDNDKSEIFYQKLTEQHNTNEFETANEKNQKNTKTNENRDDDSIEKPVKLRKNSEDMSGCELLIHNMRLLGYVFKDWICILLCVTAGLTSVALIVLYTVMSAWFEHDFNLNAEQVLCFVFCVLSSICCCFLCVCFFLLCFWGFLVCFGVLRFCVCLCACLCVCKGHHTFKHFLPLFC